MRLLFRVASFLVALVSLIYMLISPRWDALIAFLTGITIFLGSFLDTNPKKQQTDSSSANSVEVVTRTIYLDWLQQDTENRLDVSIHRTRFIDLNMIEKLSATRPWTYVGYLPNTPPEEFSDFDQAFQHYRERVLLIGNPGAGKTTTLLDLTTRLVQQAKSDINAPIPILINLSQWRGEDKSFWRGLSFVKLPIPFFSSKKTRQHSFSNWIANIVSELHGPQVPYEVAESWFREGYVALLLDGLDEIQQSERVSFIQLLNEYITNHPYMPVVVTSRPTDYAPLQINQDTRLALEGAVTLQPLTHEQVNVYLTEAQAIPLRDALLNDTELYELAQVPLTLSMMTLAYGNSAPNPSVGSMSLEDRRRNLFDFYVDRMITAQNKT